MPIPPALPFKRGSIIRSKPDARWALTRPGPALPTEAVKVLGIGPEDRGEVPVRWATLVATYSNVTWMSPEQAEKLVERLPDDFTVVHYGQRTGACGKWDAGDRRHTFAGEPVEVTCWVCKGHLRAGTPGQDGGVSEGEQRG